MMRIPLSYSASTILILVLWIIIDGCNRTVAVEIVPGPAEPILFVESNPESIVLVTQVVDHQGQGFSANHDLQVQVTDLETGYQFSTIYYTGRTTPGTNGRYQIGSLKRNSWYGIVYRDTVHTPYRYVHVDRRLVKTKSGDYATNNNNNNNNNGAGGDGPDSNHNQQKPTLYTANLIQLGSDVVYAAFYPDPETLQIFNFVLKSTISCTNNLLLKKTKTIRYGTESEDSWGIAFEKRISAFYGSSTSGRNSSSREDGSPPHKEIGRETQGIESYSSQELCQRICIAVWLHAVRQAAPSSEAHNYYYDQSCYNVDRTLPLIEYQQIQGLIAGDSYVSLLTTVPQKDQHRPLTPAETISSRSNDSNTAAPLGRPDSKISIKVAPLVLNESQSRAEQECRGNVTEEYASGGEKYTVSGLARNCWYRLLYTFQFTEPSFHYGHPETRIFRTRASPNSGPIFDPQIVQFDSRIERDKLQVKLRRSYEFPPDLGDLLVNIQPFCGEPGAKIRLTQGEPQQIVELDADKIAKNHRKRTFWLNEDNCEQICWDYEIAEDSITDKPSSLGESCVQLSGMIQQHDQKSRGNGADEILPFIILSIFSNLAAIIIFNNYF